MAADMAKGFAVFAGVAPEIIRASAREAEARGFASFWVNHPGPVDGLGSLAQAGAETQRIDLGVGVIPLHTRGPEAIVAGVRQHGLAPARLLLGVGSPNPQALARVRDGVAAIRKSLTTRIIVAALGPKMCELAGAGRRRRALQLADARVRAPLRRAGARGGQGRRAADAADLRLRAAWPSARAPRTGSATRAGATRPFPRTAPTSTRMGVKPVDTAIAATSAEGIKTALAGLAGAVDEVVLRAIVANDTVEDHLTLLRAL